ncbi:MULTISPECIES: thioredoxin domain-containing protein [unclassified Nodularia (in: cyanobacteria)]|uniref:TlpA family protein disulfide reductase n=1 Tax=unclassified Nodularia (in: cyanobacteria) TaxID=2656917 RepID=UPI001882B53E|nr:MULTISPECIES: thioredoxin domain-containing protein [unclassified Nodularia (in: cyanobacteria)]MBE9201519.1 redoxin domain-containing protein [Nodularia sp. LEGE 06071]MCC2694412.1 redoxin domain-containing protein [Nodularia sp. LEGE 04288]
MYKSSKFFLSLLCLSGLVLTVSCSATNPDNISQNQASPSTTDVAQSNPCASKNPCAAKAKTVGGPLAQEIQDKPVLVDVFASWCSACKNIAPTLSQLEKDYEGKVHFVVLDVSDKATTAQAEAKAKELGLSEFLSANKSQTGMLTIVEPKTGKILAQHRNNPNLADYKTVLDTALTQ